MGVPRNRLYVDMGVTQIAVVVGYLRKERMIQFRQELTGVVEDVPLSDFLVRLGITRADVERAFREIEG